MKKLIYGLTLLAGVAAAFIAGATLQRTKDYSLCDEFCDGQLGYIDME